MTYGTKSVSLSASGNAVATPARIIGLHITTTAAGSVAIYDALTASGTAFHTIPMAAAGTQYFDFRGEETIFETGISLGLTTTSNVTVFYK